MWGTFCYNSRILIFACVCFSISVHICIHTVTHMLTITPKEDWKDIYQNVSLVSSRGRDFCGVFFLHETLLYSEYFLWACIISKLNKIKSKERKVPINRSYCLNHLHLLHMSIQRSQSLFLSSARTHTCTDRSYGIFGFVSCGLWNFCFRCSFYWTKCLGDGSMSLCKGWPCFL